MNVLAAAAVSSLLFAVQPHAEDARRAANQVMREALLKQAIEPRRPPALPDRLPTQPRPTPEKAPPQKKDAGDAGHEAARRYGVGDANAMRARMANQAAMGMKATGQGTWDMGQGMWGMGPGSWDSTNAAWMMRWRMNPGGGCCCCGMGPGGMSPGVSLGGVAPGGPGMGPGPVTVPPGGVR